jgi:hypothetical protein
MTDSSATNDAMRCHAGAVGLVGAWSFPARPGAHRGGGQALGALSRPTAVGYVRAQNEVFRPWLSLS